MAKRSKVETQVPQELRDEFNARLVDGGFSNYDDLTDWLNTELNRQGLKIQISRSSAYRYGKDFQDQFERDMSESRQMYQIAKTALANNEDSEGILREATILNTQSRLLRLSGALRELEDSGSDVAEIADITCKITRALSDIGRLDIMSQKYKTEVRARTQAAAEKISKTAQQKGFSAETIESIKRDILGIAD